MLMLRCGPRVDEVAKLSPDDIDYMNNQIFVRSGKGGEDIVAYISNDTAGACWSGSQRRNEKSFW
ncbi:hypothetical protein LA52FAK_17650 [Desulforhopalus sp. 52FAK]